MVPGAPSPQNQWLLPQCVIVIDGMWLAVLYRHPHDTITQSHQHSLALTAAVKRYRPHARCRHKAAKSCQSSNGTNRHCRSCYNWCVGDSTPSPAAHTGRFKTTYGQRTVIASNTVNAPTIHMDACVQFSSAHMAQIWLAFHASQHPE